MSVPHSLGADALKLPPTKRARLARLLILSLEDREDVAQARIEKAWDEEIERRVSDIQRGKAKGIPAEEVFAKVRSRLK